MEKQQKLLLEFISKKKKPLKVEKIKEFWYKHFEQEYYQSFSKEFNIAKKSLGINKITEKTFQQIKHEMDNTNLKENYILTFSDTFYNTIAKIIENKDFKILANLEIVHKNFYVVEECKVLLNLLQKINTKIFVLENGFEYSVEKDTIFKSKKSKEDLQILIKINKNLYEKYNSSLFMLYEQEIQENFKINVHDNKIISEIFGRKYIKNENVEKYLQFRNSLKIYAYRIKYQYYNFENVVQEKIQNDGNIVDEKIQNGVVGNVGNVENDKIFNIFYRKPELIKKIVLESTNKENITFWKSTNFNNFITENFQNNEEFLTKKQKHNINSKMQEMFFGLFEKDFVLLFKNHLGVFNKKLKN